MIIWNIVRAIWCVFALIGIGLLMLNVVISIFGMLFGDSRNKKKYEKMTEYHYKGY